jgi:hypothetical protein
MFTEKQNHTQPATARQETAGSAKGRTTPSILWFQGMLARARKQGLFAVWGTLTPDLAQYLIANHMPEGSNRNLRERRVARFAEMIELGAWDGNTHQGIAFATTGIVNDGQHRIHGVARGKKSVEIMMTFGQPRETFHVIDQEMGSRSAGDLLDLDGLQLGGANHAAVVANTSLALAGTDGAYSDRYRAVLKPQILQFCRDNENDIRRAIRFGNTLARGVGSRLSTSSAAAAMFQIIKAGADEAHMVGFVDAMASGANLARTNPILVCREGLKDRYYGGEQRGDRERRLHEMAAIIKAWNAWRWGDQIRSKAALSLKSLSDFPAVRP